MKLDDSSNINEGKSINSKEDDQTGKINKGIDYSKYMK